MDEVTATILEYERRLMEQDRVRQEAYQAWLRLVNAGVPVRSGPIFPPQQPKEP